MKLKRAVLYTTSSHSRIGSAYKFFGSILLIAWALRHMFDNHMIMISVCMFSVCSIMFQETKTLALFCHTDPSCRMVALHSGLQALTVTRGWLSFFWELGPTLTYRRRWEQWQHSEQSWPAQVSCCVWLNWAKPLQLQYELICVEQFRLMCVTYIPSHCV